MAHLKEIEVELVFKRDDFRAQKISLKKGAGIKNHTTPVPALLVVLQGCINFHYPEESYQLDAGTTFSILPQKEHWIEAEEESILLLIK